MSGKLSHELTEKAEGIINSNLATATLYVAGMCGNLENTRPGVSPIDMYNAMVSFTRSELKYSGQFTAEEFEKIDYDSFVEPFVDEIDCCEDSYHVQIAKRAIMGILRSHLPKEFED